MASKKQLKRRITELCAEVERKHPSRHNETLAAERDELLRALVWEIRRPINVTLSEWTNEEIQRYLSDRFGLRVKVGD